MGDVDYLIPKLRGTAESSVGKGAVVVAKSNSNARKAALRYPSLGVVVGCILAQAPVEFCGAADGMVGEISFSRFLWSGLLRAKPRGTGSHGTAVREGT